MDTHTRDDDSKIAERSGTIEKFSAPQFGVDKQRVVDALNGLTIGFDSPFSVFKNGFRNMMGGPERPLALREVEGFQARSTYQNQISDKIDEFYILYNALPTSLSSTVYFSDQTTNPSFSRSVISVDSILSSYIRSTSPYVIQFPGLSGGYMYFKWMNSSTTRRTVYITPSSKNGIATTGSTGFTLTTGTKYLTNTRLEYDFGRGVRQIVFGFTNTGRSPTCYVSDIFASLETSPGITVMNPNVSISPSYSSSQYTYTLNFVSDEYIDYVYTSYLARILVQSYIYYILFYSKSKYFTINVSNNDYNSAVGVRNQIDGLNNILQTSKDIFDKQITDYRSRLNVLRANVATHMTNVINAYITINSIFPSGTNVSTAAQEVASLSSTTSFTVLEILYNKYCINMPSSFPTLYANTIILPMLQEYLLQTYDKIIKYINPSTIDTQFSGIVTRRGKFVDYLQTSPNGEIVASASLTTLSFSDISKIYTDYNSDMVNIVNLLASTYHTTFTTTLPAPAALNTSADISTIKTRRDVYLQLWQDKFSVEKNIVSDYKDTINYIKNTLKLSVPTGSDTPSTELQVSENNINNMFVSNPNFDLNFLKTRNIYHSFSSSTASLNTGFSNNIIKGTQVFSRVFDTFTMSSSYASISSVEITTTTTSSTNIGFSFIGSNNSTLIPFNLLYGESVALESGTRKIKTISIVSQKNIYRFYSVAVSGGSTSYPITLDGIKFIVKSFYKSLSTTDSERSIVKLYSDPYLTKLNNILPTYRQAALSAITSFITKYNTFYLPIKSNADTNPEYEPVRKAFADSTANSTSISSLNNLVKIKEIEDNYIAASSIFNLAAKRIDLRTAIDRFNLAKTQTETVIKKTITVAVSPSTYIDSNGNWTTSITSLTTADAYDTPINTVDNGTREIIRQLLTEFNTYRTGNILDATILQQIPSADTDLGTLTTAIIDEIISMQTTYVSTRWPALQKTAADFVVAIQEKLLNSATSYKSTKVEAAKYATLPTTNTDVNAADINLAIVLKSDGTALSAAATASTVVVLQAYIPVFDKAIKIIVEFLLDEYNKFRDANVKDPDLLAATVNATQVASNKAYMTSAEKVLEIRNTYIGNTNANWPTLKRLGTKMSSRIAVLEAFTAFVLYYSEFKPLYADVQEDYYNSGIRTIAQYLDVNYQPLASFLSMESERLDEIRADFLPTSTLFTGLVEDIRKMMKTRVDDFNNRFNANRSVIAASGIIIPTVLGTLPTDSTAFLDPLSDSKLIERKQAYYDTIGADKKIKKGYISMLDTLISDAIVENKRKAVVAAIETCVESYTSAASYMDQSVALSSSVAMFAGTAKTTYYNVSEQARQKGLLDLPLGSDKDLAAEFPTSTTGVASLFQLQYVYEVCTRGVVSALIREFRKFYDEKAALKRAWSPGAAAMVKDSGLTSADDQIVLNAATSVARVVEIRDEYMGLWNAVSTAAKAQLSAQIDAYTGLKAVATKREIPLGTLVDPTTGKPTADTPAYELKAVYAAYEDAGQKLVEAIRTWLNPYISEYNSLYLKYSSFQQDAEVQSVRVVGALETDGLQNTTQRDDTALKLYEFHTQGIATVLDDLSDKYLRKPDGGIPKLQAVVRTNLATFIEEFKKSWEASPSSTRESYTSYDADKAVAANAAATSKELERVIANYTTYTDDLWEAGLQQNVLNTMIVFNTDLYLANATILNVNPATSRGSTIATAANNMLNGPEYVSRIGRDEITDISQLQNIRRDYFEAISALAEQIEEDMNIKLDEFVGLYDKYTTFTQLDLTAAEGLVGVAAIPGTLTKGGIATDKSDLSAAIQTIKTAAASKDSEVIAVSTQVAVINRIRTAILTALTALRAHISGEFSTFIRAFNSAYDAISRQEVKDPYTTYTADMALVSTTSETGLASSADLTKLIASYTGYVDDLLTSNYQLRALTAIYNFYSKLYVANAAAVLPALTTIASSVDPKVMTAISDAMADTKAVSNDSQTDEIEDRTQLVKVREKYQDAADAFVPYILGRVSNLLRNTNQMYQAYEAFYAANRTMRDGSPFVAALQTYSEENTAPSLLAGLEAYANAGYSDAVVAAMDVARSWVVRVQAALKTFIEEQLTIFGTTLGSIAEDQAAIAAAAPGVAAPTIGRILQGVTERAMGTVIQEKQQKLSNTIDRFIEELYTPNRDVITPPSAGSVIATRIAAESADRATVATIPQTGTDYETRMLGMREYKDTLNSLQSSYDSAIEDLLASIRSAITALLAKFNTAYQPNKDVFALPGAPVIEEAVRTVIDAIDSDAKSISTITAGASITALRERYEAANASIFTALKTVFSEQLTNFSNLFARYEGFRASNAAFKKLKGIAETTIENTADSDKDILKDAQGLTESVVEFLNDLRTRVLFGSFPRLRSFIRDELRAYIDYFNVQYSEVSASESKEPYTSYTADVAAVSQTADPSAADLERLMRDYTLYTAQLTTANIQQRVIEVLRNFNNMYLDNYNIVKSSVNSAITAGATDISGILGRIRNNVENEIDDTVQLLEIEERYRGLVSELMGLVKTEILSRLDEYVELRGRYLLFVQDNRGRFMAALGNLLAEEYTEVGVDKQAIESHIAYSSTFVSDSNRIRNTVLAYLTSIRSEISRQLVSYINFFAAKYGERTLRNLDEYLKYTDAMKTADIAKTDYIALMNTYTSYTNLLLTAAKQEDAATAIETYKNALYDPNHDILGTAALTSEMRNQADAAAADLAGVVADKRGVSLKDVAATTATIASLTTTETSYSNVASAFVAAAKSVMAADIDIYRNLYNNYVAFDTSFSSFYDLETIPSTLVDAAAVSRDLQGLSSAEPTVAGAATISQIRIRYYGDGSTTQFAMFGTLVRFVMAQLKLYIERYSNTTNDLPDNLKPQGISSATTAEHLARVGGGSYVGVADMSALLTIVELYIDNTPSIQSAVRVNMRKVETRNMMNQFLESKKYFNDTVGSAVVRQYLPATLNTVADLSQLDSATTLTAIDAINTNYVQYIRKLAADSMATFNKSYGENVFMKAYFVKTAIDVFNTFNVYFEEDAVKVGASNTVEQNIGVVKTYADRTKIILDARGSAAEVKENTDAYKTATVNVIRSVKRERDVGLTTLSEAIMSADTDSAEQLVGNATYISDMEPTRLAYDRYLKNIRDAATALVQKRIDEFMAEYNKVGSINVFFSDEIQSAVSEIKSAKGQLTKLLQTSKVEGFIAAGSNDFPPLTAEQAKILVAKYEELLRQLKSEADPATGILYKNARSRVEVIINEYVLHTQTATRIRGIDTTKFESETIALTNATRDKKLVDASTSFEVLAAKYTEYTDKQEVLTKYLRSYALDIMENGFTKYYKQIEDEKLLEWASEGMKTAAAEATKATAELKAAKTSYTDTMRIITTYMGYIENIRLELGRAQALKALTRVKSLLIEATTLDPKLKFGVGIPSVATVDAAIANVRITKVAGFLPTVQTQYASIASAIITQFAAGVGEAIRNYKTALADAKTALALPYLTEQAKGLATVADEDLTLLSSSSSSGTQKTLAELNALRLRYVEATGLIRSEMGSVSDKVKFETIKNAVSGLIVEYEAVIEIAKSIPALKLGGESVVDDKAILGETSTTMATLSSLQKKYAGLVSSARSYMQKMALQYIDNFNQSLISNKARKDSFSAAVKEAIPKISADAVKAGAATTTYIEHRDMIRKYADLSAQLISSVPVGANLDANRTDTLALINNYEISVQAARSYPQITATAVSTAADRSAVAVAATFEALSAIRTKYLQLNYDIGRRIEEAKTASDALLRTRRMEAQKAIADFRGAFEKAAIDLREFPQLADASNKMSAYSEQVAAKDTTIDTLVIITGIYKKALDVVLYKDAADSTAARDSKKEAAILAMNAFTQLYQANDQLSARFSDGLRKAVFSIPNDMIRVQNPATSLADITGIIERYESHAKQLAYEIQGSQREAIQELIYRINRLRGQYSQLAPAQVDALPSYLRLDVRILDRDIETLRVPEVDAHTVATLKEKYGQLIPEYEKRAPRPVGASDDQKTALVAVIRDLNTLFSTNMSIFSTLPTKVQLRIRAIPTDIKYLLSDDITPAEVDQMETEYRLAITEMKSAIDMAFKKGSGTATASLQMMINAFSAKYSSTDISRLSGTDYNFIQLLMQNRQNAVVMRDVAKATAAYTRGIEVLSKVAESQGVVEDNPEYVRLKMIINYFLSEYPIRNMSRAISNDRLYLSNLRINATSYLTTYKTPAPNMRNYDILVDQLVGQYRDGLKLLRTYPLKAA
jgi:hypothetical protein